MAIKLEVLNVGRIELQKAMWHLCEYLGLFEMRDVGRRLEFRLKEDSLKKKEEELRQEVIKILTDSRYSELPGYMHPDRVQRYKLLTRVRLCMNKLKYHLNAMKR